MAGKNGAAKIPLRSCLVCRDKMPKRELLRHICADADGAVQIIEDSGQKMPGRGFYVCNRETCRERFAKACRRRCHKKQDTRPA